MTRSHDQQIRSRPKPDCHVCGARGVPLYERLSDRLFRAPGKWRLKRCPDASCGSLWLDPMPTEEDIGLAYTTYFTHQDHAPRPPSLLDRLSQRVRRGYLAIEYGYGGGQAKTLDRFLGWLICLYPARRADLDFGAFYLDSRPGGSLLEIGCGNGNMLKRMQDLGWRVEGVDFDPKAVAKARAEGLRVHLGDLKTLSLDDTQYDAIVMSHLIEHVHDPRDLLRQCYRLLKPGGRLVAITPNVSSWGHCLFRRHWLHLDPPRHLHLFSLPSLCRIAQEAGLQAVRTWTTVRDGHNSFRAGRDIRKTGKHVMGRPCSLPETALWRTVQMLQWVSLRFGPDRGEEIVLMAEKR